MFTPDCIYPDCSVRVHMPGFVISVTVIVTVKLEGAVLSGLSVCPHCSVRLHKSDYVMSVTVTVGV